MSVSLVPYSDQPRETGKAGFFGALFLLGLLGAGAGAGLALYVSDHVEHRVRGQVRQAQGFAQTLPFPPSTRLQVLKPVVTNLASPKEAWIRLQAALLLEEESPDDATIMRKKVEEDFVAYLRTLHLGHLEGSAGLQHLREDLTERAKTRTKGKVQEVILESVVIQ